MRRSNKFYTIQKPIFKIIFRNFHPNCTRLAEGFIFSKKIPKKMKKTMLLLALTLFFSCQQNKTTYLLYVSINIAAN